MSVIGQAEGIVHGTVKGWRQHRYRQVEQCERCLEAKRKEVRAQGTGQRNRAKSAVAAAATAEWFGGAFPPGGAPRPPTDIPAPGQCGVELCGGLAEGEVPASMALVNLVGSREPARCYCPGFCTVYGQALAEIRAIGGVKA